MVSYSQMKEVPLRLSSNCPSLNWPEIPDQEHNLINFHVEEIVFSLQNPRTYEDWLLRIAEAEDKSIQVLNYIFCTDDFLLQKNQEFLAHDTLTDVITFQYSEEPLSGDVFISVERVRENAASFKVSFEQELKRVMAHGLLHLCGYGDKTEEEKKLMREKEDACLGFG